MTKNYSEFSNKKVSTLFWQYALPAIVGSTVSTLYNIIDGIFIGHWIGSDALSAAGLILPIMTIAAATGLLVGVGAAGRISIFLGQKQLDKAERIVGTSFLLTLILSGIVISTLLFFIDPLLYFAGADETNHAFAKSFLIIFLPGSIFLTLAFNYVNMMRACGFPLKAMIIMLISVVANIILAPIFIIILDLGMKGAALATSIAMFISFVLVMHHFTSNKSPIRLRLKYIKLNKEYIVSILSIGMSPFAMQVASALVVVYINRQLNYYAPFSDLLGREAIAAYSNANRLITFIFMIIVGINQGMQPIIGYNFGAKDFSRVKETLFYAVRIATIVTAIAFIFGMFMPHFLVSAFTDEEAIVDLSSSAFRIITLSSVLLGFQIVTAGFFQCIGMAKISIVLSLSRQVFILIPMLFILPLFFGLDGVWFSIPVSDLLSGMLAFFYLNFYLKKMTKDNETINN